MDKEYYANKEIQVYWWNMGRKTLDYRGSYEGFLKKKNITITKTLKGTCAGYHYYISLSTTEATLDAIGDYAQCCNEAIKIFLTLMGDKAKLVTPKGEYFIN